MNFPAISLIASYCFVIAPSFLFVFALAQITEFLFLTAFLFQRNIDVCPECGNLKLKHVLCSYCYAKVKAETQQIRKEIGKKEGGPFNAPTVETVVLYDGEKPTEKDEGKRIIERARKRPSWFIRN